MNKMVFLAAIVGYLACGEIAHLQAYYYIPPQPVYRPVYTPPPPVYHPTYTPAPTYHPVHTNNTTNHSYSNHSQHTASGNGNSSTASHHHTPPNGKNSDSNHSNTASSNGHSTQNKTASNGHPQQAGANHQQVTTTHYSTVLSKTGASAIHVGEATGKATRHTTSASATLEVDHKPIADQSLRVNPALHGTPAVTHAPYHPLPGNLDLARPVHHEPIGFPHRPIFPGPHHLSSGFVTLGLLHGVLPTGHVNGLVVVNGPIHLPGPGSLDWVYVVPTPGDMLIVHGIPIDADGFIMDIPTPDEIAADPSQYGEGPSSDELAEEYQQEMADPNWQGRVASDDGEDSLSVVEDSSVADGASTSDQPSGPVTDSGAPVQGPAGSSSASSSASSPVAATTKPTDNSAPATVGAPAASGTATASNTKQPPAWLMKLADETEENDQARSTELKAESQQISSELQLAQGAASPSQDPTGYSEALADLSSSNAQPQ